MEGHVGGCDIPTGSAIRKVAELRTRTFLLRQWTAVLVIPTPHSSSLFSWPGGLEWPSRRLVGDEKKGARSAGDGDAGSPLYAGVEYFLPFMECNTPKKGWFLQAMQTVNLVCTWVYIRPRPVMFIILYFYFVFLLQSCSRTTNLFITFFHSEQSESFEFSRPQRMMGAKAASARFFFFIYISFIYLFFISGMFFRRHFVDFLLQQCPRNGAVEESWQRHAVSEFIVCLSYLLTSRHILGISGFC